MPKPSVIGFNIDAAIDYLNMLQKMIEDAARADQIKCRKCEANLNELELVKYAAYQQNYPETHQNALLGNNESTASDAWSELDEKRVDVVGQNGNDGLHYE